MLIGLALGAVVALLAASALRFVRMDDTAEQAQFARRERRQAVFEGVMTARAARELVPDALLTGYAGERVKVTVERLKPEPDAARVPPPAP